MNRETAFTLCLLVINTVIALFYMLVQYIRGKGSYVILRGILMILCPVTGIAIYGLSFVVGILFRNEEVDYDAISMSKERKQFLQKIDKEKEAQVLPMEEILMVSSPKERRRAMMNLLRMDTSKNLGLLRRAVENEDVETSHYAASALTDCFGKVSVQFQEYQARYDEDHEAIEPARAYFKAISELLVSEVLVGAEKKRYQYTLVQIADNMYRYHSRELLPEEYKTIVHTNRDLGRTKEALKFAQLELAAFPNAEQSYLDVLYAAYFAEDEALFATTLQQLKASKIPLSKAGSEVMRNWGSTYIHAGEGSGDK